MADLRFIDLNEAATPGADYFVPADSATDGPKKIKPVNLVSKTTLGLENVDNTSDANKPISTATQNALDLKANASALGALAAKNKITVGTDIVSAGVPSSSTALYGDGVWRPVVAGGSAPPGVMLADFLPAGDGVTDDSAALANFIAAINLTTGGNVVGYLGAGSYAVASASLASSPLAITRDNVTLVGDNAKIIVTGTSDTPYIFGSSNKSGMTYRGIRFYGNNVSTGFATAAAISFTNTTTEISDLQVENCYFENFKADYWIYVQTLGTAAIKRVHVHNNAFVSKTGNARGPSSIGISSSFVLVYGVGTQETSYVQDVHITGNDMDGTHVKVGIHAFHNCRDVHIKNNTLHNFGATTDISDDVGCYSILCYENGSNYSQHAEILGNIITNARDNGIYLAGQWLNSIVTDNIVDGQSYANDDANVKGGISLNGARQVTVTGNRLLNIAARGVTWDAGNTANQDVRVVISNNVISDAKSGVRLGGYFYDNRNISLTGNIIAECLIGVEGRMFAPGSLSDVAISDNTIKSTVSGSFGIRFYSEVDSSIALKAVVQNNVIEVQQCAISIPVAAGPLVVRGNSLIGPTALHIDIHGSLGVSFCENDFYNQSSGNCVYSDDAHGNSHGNTFSNVAVGHAIYIDGANALGYLTPTFTPTGDQVFVQNLGTGELGTAGSKYVVLGWLYTVSAWVPMRVLTGN